MDDVEGEAGAGGRGAVRSARTDTNPEARAVGGWEVPVPRARADVPWLCSGERAGELQGEPRGAGAGAGSGKGRGSKAEQRRGPWSRQTSRAARLARGQDGGGAAAAPGSRLPGSGCPSRRVTGRARGTGRSRASERPQLPRIGTGMAAAVRRAEPPLAPAPLGVPGPAPGERGELPPPGKLPAAAAHREPAGQEGDAESPGESEPEAWGGEGGAGPGAGKVPSGALDLEGEEGAWEPLLDQREAPAACGPPSAPLPGGHLCPASAPLSLVPAAGSSPGAPQGLPSLERTSSQTSSRSLSPSGGGAGEQAPGSAAESCCAQGEAGSAEEECPICTEPYDSGRHTQALLNCSHVLCSDCLHAIMDRAGAAEIGRVRCPICRQKTPMLEWEICKLQEELLLLHAQPAPASPLALPMPPPLPPRRPGLCGALEHHFQVRFHTSRMFGCLPCVRYPLCLVSGLGILQRRCRCCYLLSLAALLAAETLSLLLIFLPIVLLVLLFLILDK
ncbi:putative E3 ubiquitin-protein ligase RNF183 [Platysternon megacephalum]|uniref:Putative E3 ubiquitin-protein ligase RNF183 n=1 Tax=Platysternon megacephalum TaxID=55544 RepID=A0A4D9DTZ3_9SAUR|nr:putative E3 ubiquitin-protein ligase RNF183 [Platysternon megacephalum]